MNLAGQYTGAHPSLGGAARELAPGCGSACFSAPVPGVQPFPSGTRNARADHGYAMAVLLVALSVMSIMLVVVMPVWKQTIRREKESELVFRGEQYVRAIRLFQSRYASANPPNIDVLVEQRFLRKKYKDPITGDDFQVLTQSLSAPAGGQPGQQPGGRSGAGPGQPTATMGAVAAARPGAVVGGSGGVLGVVSKSTEKSIRLYNGRSHYNEWVFQYVAQTRTPGGVPGSTAPGQVPGQPQMPAGPGGRGFGRGRGGPAGMTTTPSGPGR
jgi:type II secretory pathway pseudopilin PulG